jgi:HK97 family phage prohead protease
MKKKITIVENESIEPAIFFREGKSKYGEEESIRYKVFTFESVKVLEENGKFFIEGFASTEAIDSYKEIVRASAFNSSIEEFMRDSLLLFGHDWYSIPIGMIVRAEIRENVGLWVRAEIIGGRPEVQDIKLLIQRGVLKYFSIGFRVLKVTEDKEAGIVYIDDLMLLEISVVNKGANPLSLFTNGKDSMGGVEVDAAIERIRVKCNDNINSLNEGRARNMSKQITVDDLDGRMAKVESYFGEKNGLPDLLDGVQKSIADLSKLQKDQIDNIKTIQEKTDQRDKGLIGTAEFKVFTEKVGAEILKISNEIQTIQRIEGVKRARYPYKDWSALDNDAVYLRDNNRNPLSPVHQKAYRLFNLPVDYESNDIGRAIKMARDLNDTIVICNAYFGHKSGWSPTALKAYGILRNLLDGLDPEFAKAMYSSGAGLGDEWVPTMMSAAMEEFYRLQPSLEKYFPTVDMPSQPYDYPIKAGGVTCYLGDEAITDNPPTARMSNFATANLRFDAKLFMGALAVSPQLVEDSIVPVIPEIQREISFGLLESYENAMINGDTTATHMDADVTTTYDIQTAFKGLRRIAKDDSKEFDVLSASAGVGDGTSAFVAKDVRYIRKLAGPMGINPSDWVYYTGMAGWYTMLNLSEVTKANEFGAASTWLTGKLPVFDGCELYVSSQVKETLHTSGVYTNGSALKTHIGGFHRRGFRNGVRRGILMEYEKNILTQQMSFVGSTRKSFIKFAAATRYPSANGYNL